MKVKYVVVYKTGPKFTADSIHLLRRQVERHDRNEEFEFMCITDHEGLLHDCPEWTLSLNRRNVEGWWCLPEKFRIVGPVVFTGIDTIICGDLAPFANVARECPTEKIVYMIHPFKIPNHFNRLYANGVMIWNGNHKWFYRDYNYTMAATQFPLEQDYTSAMFIKNGYDIRVVQHAIPGIYSWKASLDRSMGAPPEDTCMILFHGKEKPHLFTSGWIFEHVKRFL